MDCRLDVSNPTLRPLLTVLPPTLPRCAPSPLDPPDERLIVSSNTPATALAPLPTPRASEGAIRTSASTPPTICARSAVSLPNCWPATRMSPASYASRNIWMSVCTPRSTSWASCRRASAELSSACTPSMNCPGWLASDHSASPLCRMEMPPPRRFVYHLQSLS